MAGLQDGDRAAVLVCLPFDVAGFVAVAGIVTAGSVVVAGRVAVEMDVDAVVPDGDVALRRGDAAFVPVAAGVVADTVARHAVGDGAAFVVVAEVVALGAAAEGKQGGKEGCFHGGLRVVAEAEGRAIHLVAGKERAGSSLRQYIAILTKPCTVLRLSEALSV